MSKTTLQFPGMEPEKLTAEEAVAMFRAAALLREPCTLRHHGRTTSIRDIARPDRLTKLQASMAERILTWKLQAVFMRLGVGYTVVEGLADGPALLELEDGTTIGPSYAPATYRRAAEKWHVFDPEGDPILENVTMAAAMLAAWERVDRSKKASAVAAAIESLNP